MKEPSKIDIRAKKTEAQWIMVSDHFWLAVTPRLFEWLRWTVILAAVAQATTRIEIGTCILNPYTINPAEMKPNPAIAESVWD